MSRGFKIFMLVVLSIGFGIAGLYGTIGLLNLIWETRISFTEPFDRYPFVYGITTAIPVGLLAAVWLDKLMNIGLLPEGMVERDE
jgi:hypothetical protein